MQCTLFLNYWSYLDGVDLNCIAIGCMRVVELKSFVACLPGKIRDGSATFISYNCYKIL